MSESSMFAVELWYSRLEKNVDRLEKAKEASFALQSQLNVISDSAV